MKETVQCICTLPHRQRSLQMLLRKPDIACGKPLLAFSPNGTSFAKSDTGESVCACITYPTALLLTL